jgi:hypothetical protein
MAAIYLEDKNGVELYDDGMSDDEIFNVSSFLSSFYSDSKSSSISVQETRWNRLLTGRRV